MEHEVQNLMLLTLPGNLREQASQLISVSKTNEEERLLKHSYKYGRYHSHRREHHVSDSDEQVKSQAKKAAIPLAIAQLIMKLWSPKMRRHAEKLILQKGVEEGYLKEHHFKWVHVLEDQEEECNQEESWFIDNIDDTIIKLVWDIFDMKTHYSQVTSHRLWILRSYHRLKEFMPSLQEEIIDRHDLTKYAFSQAVGYTLKWVHTSYHEIWKTACDFHLFNEPHHPQAWSKVHTPEEKRTKLLKWLSGASDSHTGCPYGLDITNLDLSTEDFAEPFLLESYIDMVGVEWERKKGMDLNISTRNLAFIDDKFLARYTKKQHRIIRNLIEKITAADQSWNNLDLTAGESFLLSTVPAHRKGKFACQLEMQRKNEMSRMEYRAPAGISKAEAELQKQEAMKKAQIKSFYILIAKTVTELWDPSFRNRVENLILKKAVMEKQIKSNYIDWILVFENKDSSQAETSSKEDSDELPIKDEDIVKLLWDEFMLSEHFTQVQQHRHWIRQSYQHLAHFMPELPEEVIERHDLSKLAFSQSIGYTLKWVHNINLPVWRKACDLHLNNEPHHPQLWCNKNTVEHKQNCLEKWLGDRESYGVVVSALDLKSENMARVFLLESLIDMVAVEWERNKGQKPDMTYTELIYMEEKFLSRYTPSDKTFIMERMSVIREADNPQPVS
ncbi:hypothetical protein E2C01_018341 [Portunus trituberculatus]|uniref:Uncharacterized protein n=1 Tax=Portunus trituberculatus TaxID=210409 RepID=A0A5B7DW69_PORTR|nr:hypothetical protein [Portunus trituberculatus]